LVSATVISPTCDDRLLPMDFPVPCHVHFLKAGLLFVLASARTKEWKDIVFSDGAED
jgi:hypothetical protein